NFFLTRGGANRPGKACLLIGVNVDHTEVPETYTHSVRKIMLGKNGENLVTLWSSSRPADRLDFVKRVSREIFLVAQEHMSANLRTNRNHRSKSSRGRK